MGTDPTPGMGSDSHALRSEHRSGKPRWCAATPQRSLAEARPSGANEGHVVTKLPSPKQKDVRASASLE